MIQVKGKYSLSVGKVAKTIGVETHTIRFWTTEFEQYIDFSTGKGDRRYYSEQALETFAKINDFIHNQGIKIRSIKENKLLEKDKQENQSNQNIEEAIARIDNIIDTVKDFLDNLN